MGVLVVEGICWGDTGGNEGGMIPKCVCVQ